MNPKKFQAEILHWHFATARNISLENGCDQCRDPMCENANLMIIIMGILFLLINFVMMLTWCCLVNLGRKDPRRPTCYPHGLNGSESYLNSPESRNLVISSRKVSTQTIRRRLQQHGLLARRRRLGLPLTNGVNSSSRTNPGSVCSTMVAASVFGITIVKVHCQLAFDIFILAHHLKCWYGLQKRELLARRPRLGLPLTLHHRHEKL
ncbi:hypothetical protein LAZ67_7000583 [Cordylochernes scorpioides]|uniref:Uncharacterized protein n=1 Tax=Cordylochernes scorpioides TaxID=51811 RepID=A0ABY6KLL6_9ARAC|nr:hypothetical protein LAZ67_7000583 [Cordylochernes scorpioides]